MIVFSFYPDKKTAGTRFYIHGRNIAAAVLFLIKNGTLGEKYNIVSNQESDNLELAQIIAEIMGKPLKYELVDPKITRPRHDFRYALCGRKMRDMGWEQEISLQEGLRHTINWFIENPEWR